MRCTPDDRDFWVSELNTSNAFKEHAPTYSGTVQWLRYFARSASDRRKNLDPKIIHADAVTIGKLTAHSCQGGDWASSQLEESRTARAQVHSKSNTSAGHDDQAVGSRSCFK